MILYRENKIANRYTITTQELVKRFKESEYYDNFVDGWPLSRALAVFIGASNGLCSTCDPISDKEFSEILHLLK